MDLEDDSWLVEHLEGFQAAWKRGDRPSLEELWKKIEILASLPLGKEAAREILVEFLKIEIEQGWLSQERTGSPTIEELELPAVAARFPEILGGPEDWPEDLIVWAYQYRSRHDQTISSSDVLGQYPGRGRSLSEKLREVDRKRPPRIAGYKVKSRLGFGGQGEVWLAESLTVPREVAVKVLWSRDPEKLHRLNLELRATGILSGRPGVVGILDARIDADPPHLIMEYVRGGDLETRVRARTGGPPNLPPPKVAARIVKELAETVDEFHREPVVMFHRDLKPANVLLAGRHDESPEELTWDDLFVKLADFGIVRLRDRDLAVTETGYPIGSPPYMAPEQISERIGRVDARTDVYGLGGILFFLIHGRPPFSALRDDPRKEPEFGPRPRGDDLKIICLKALSVEPGQRYETARELADDLARYMADQPIKARPPSPIERAWKWGRRHPALSASLIGAAMVMSLLVVLMVREFNQAQRIRRYSVAAAETLESLGFDIVADPELKAQTTLAYRTRRFEEARVVLAQFLKLEGDSAEALRLSGKAGLVLTEINRTLRHKEDALESSHRAEADFQKLIGMLGPSATPADRLGLATAMIWEGTSLAQYRIDWPGGLKKLREAYRILEDLAGSNGSSDPKLISQRAFCRNNIAVCVGGAEAARLFANSIRDYDGLIHRDPTMGGARLQAIRFRSNRAMTLEELGDPGAAAQHNEAVSMAQVALDAIDRARDTGSDPDRRLPWEWAQREALAAAANNAGEFELRKDKIGSAIPMFETSLGEYDRLASRDPLDPEFSWGTAMARTNLAIALTMQGAESWDRADGLFSRASSTYKSLRDRGLDDGEFWSFFARNVLYRGILQGRRALASGDSLDASLESINAALDMLKKSNLTPNDTVLLVEAWLRRAEIESLREQISAAESSLGRAVAAIDAIGDEEKDIVNFGYQRIEADLLRGELRSRCVQLDAADLALAKAKGAISKLSGLGEDDALGRQVRQRAEFLAAALLALRADVPDLTEVRKREATDRAIDAIESMMRSGALKDPDRRALLALDGRFRALRNEKKLRELGVIPEIPTSRKN